MPNRQLQVKADRARKEKVLAGIVEFSKPAYHTNKSELRGMNYLPFNVRRIEDPKSATPEVVTWVTYNPSKPKPRHTAMFAAMSREISAPELIKRR